MSPTVLQRLPHFPALLVFDTFQLKCRLFLHFIIVLGFLFTTVHCDPLPAKRSRLTLIGFCDTS
jgi:hypothetical protein